MSDDDATMEALKMAIANAVAEFADQRNTTLKATLIADALVSVVSAAINWTRRSGEERPLISILLAFQAGFALGRWGGRRA